MKKIFFTAKYEHLRENQAGSDAWKLIIKVPKKHL